MVILPILQIGVFAKWSIFIFLQMKKQVQTELVYVHELLNDTVQNSDPKPGLSHHTAPILRTTSESSRNHPLYLIITWC